MNGLGYPIFRGKYKMAAKMSIFHNFSGSGSARLLILVFILRVMRQQVAGKYFVRCLDRRHIEIQDGHL